MGEVGLDLEGGGFARGDKAEVEKPWERAPVCLEMGEALGTCVFRS